MRAWAASAMLSIAIVLSIGGAAQARGFRVYTCTTPDGRALGPTLDYTPLSSGWILSQSGYKNVTLNDRCVFGETFEFRLMYGSAMTAGESIWARWTAASQTQLMGIAIRWEAYADQSVGRGTGTVRLIVGTDRETLLQENSPLSVAYGIAWSTTPYHPAIQAARWFEIRFTCLVGLR